MSVIALGRFVGIFGVRGELKFRPSGAGDALVAGAEYALGAEPDAARVRCRAVRRHHARTVVALEGVTTPEAARAYVDRELYGEREQVALGPGEYLDADLIGCRLVDLGGTHLGDVVGVEHLPAQDCLVIGERRALVPLVRAFVRDVNIAARTIVVELPEGLL